MNDHVTNDDACWWAPYGRNLVGREASWNRSSAAHLGLRVIVWRLRCGYIRSFPTTHQAVQLGVCFLLASLSPYALNPDRFSKCPTIFLATSQAGLGLAAVGVLGLGTNSLNSRARRGQDLGIKSPTGIVWVGRV